MDVALSLVIPAYNEARRLPPYLVAVREYCERYHRDGYEVIVVDDGSGDGTGHVLGAMAAAWPQLVVQTHAANRGKGAAVRTGVLAARGQLVLFADADGATPIEEECRLRAAIEGGADVAVGSRLASGPGITRSRSWHRGLCGRLFARAARALMPTEVRDTQCGFKMFRRDAGLHLFGLCREDGYLFDLAILATADRLGYRVVEAAVRWRDVPGSKVHLVRDSWRMLAGLLRMRRELHASTGPISAKTPVAAVAGDRA